MDSWHNLSGESSLGFQFNSGSSVVLEVAALSLCLADLPQQGSSLTWNPAAVLSNSWLHVSQGHTSHRPCLVNDSVEDKGRSILADSGPCKVWLCLADSWVLIDFPETEQQSRKLTHLFLLLFVRLASWYNCFSNFSISSLYSLTSISLGKNFAHLILS